MADAFSSTLSIAPSRGTPNQASGLYLGAVIVVTCAFCFTPIELFVIEIWPRHGLASLLIVLLPIAPSVAVARRLPDWYYRSRRFESDGRVYEMFAIRFFKRFVPDGDYINRRARRSDPTYRLISNRPSIDAFDERTRLAERLHLSSLIFALPSMVYAVMLGWTSFALWLVLPNILFHVYPVLLQRYTRARIARVLARRRRVP